MPHRSAFLSGHGHKAEVAHRGTVRLRIAIDHDGPQPAPSRGERRGKTHHTGTDYGEIKPLRGLASRHRVAHAENRRAVYRSSMSCSATINSWTRCRNPRAESRF